VLFLRARSYADRFEVRGRNERRSATGGVERRLSFEVSDGGGGFEPEVGQGSGIQGMANRLDAIGGRLEIESEPGRGTIVRGIIHTDVAM
jgi:signal transduction histidine kinase